MRGAGGKGAGEGRTMSSLIFFAPGAKCPSSAVARRAFPSPLPSSDIAPGETSTADSRFTPRVLITSTRGESEEESEGSRSRVLREVGDETRKNSDSQIRLFVH
jgi:hypothetical protein